MKGIGSILTFAPKLVGGIKVLMGLANPWILAIAAVIAIGVVLYKNWDKIKETAQKVGAKVSEAWDNMKTKLSAASENMKDKVTAAWQKMHDGISGARRRLTPRSSP